MGTLWKRLTPGGCLLILVACRHAEPVLPTGEGAFEFVAPPISPAPERAPNLGDASAGVFATPPEPILPLATPVYPREALKGRTGRVTVGIRITVDAEGRVSEIGSSLATFSTPSPDGPAFRQAVEAAVRRWRFHPAQLQRMETKKASDGGDILVLKAVEPTDWTFDVAFAFTASGDVWSGLDHRGTTEKRSDGIGGEIRRFFVRLFSRRVL